MTPRLRRLLAGVRRRRVLGELASCLPVAAAAVLAARRFGNAPLIVVATIAVALLAWRFVSAWRGVDRAWLVRRLDARDGTMQDSSDLLFADESALGDLQRLQRARVLHALEAHATPELREPWPTRRIAAGWFVGAVVALAAIAWHPARDPVSVATPSREAEVAPIPQGITASLRITPPAYTGVAARTVDTLAARAEAGSEIDWDLAFAHEPARARLRFVEGEPLDLELVDGRWRGRRVFEQSALYRVEIEAAPPLPESTAARLEIIPDRAPQLRVLQPERTLTVLEETTRAWTLVIEATDDYGLGDAQLDITLAQGSGEQVTVSQRRIALAGKGDARQRRYEHRIDLAALGFAQGDDLIAAVQVRDRRAPSPNVARSPSFILRWPPPPATEGSGVEGLVQKAMPAYFRSQRQIIIDTEALIAERPRLTADDAMVKSDTIGADQRLLRLRYGQFLGEESETEGEHEDAPGESHGNSAQDLMAAAGHLHDLPEAATLLDPGTRALLRTALDAMWNAERELRTGNPVAALPHENRALEYIKRAQQADRIYLARVGLELTPLDATRRLTGERGALAGRADPAQAASGERVPDDAWRALQAGTTPDFDSLSKWIARERDELDDPLALLEHLDALRRDASCTACAERLARALWPSLTPPAAAAGPRPRPDRIGGEYLDAISAPETPR